MSKELVITQQGLAALEEELEQLKTVRRKEVSEKIKIARGYGDLSENSEYDEAKNEQALVESRILQLEGMLKNVRILEESEIRSDVVAVGSHVQVEVEGDTEEYDIVGSTEANPAMGKISDESPVGAGLMGLKAGNEAEITLPTGATLVYKVLKISKQKL